ncbi:MAG: DUF2877 domain-containing protein [Actinomycetota bacterium]|nr:DUF2877 domain-containing protein [Actinomycetota bacterium]
MRIPGAASTAIRAVTAGAPQPAQWLGAVDAALYFSTTDERPTVFAVLSHDAVRLPCGLVLATTKAELPLRTIAPVRDRENALVGDGRIEWAGPDGPVTIVAARQWSPLRVRTGAPQITALAELRTLLAPCELGLERGPLDGLARTAGAAAVAGLLGRGPGLTPSGDDVLAGYLLATAAFGMHIAELRRSVADRAPQATSALSAQLLRHAARGEAVGELIELVSALIHPAPRTLPAVTARLLQVGHTSGAAIGWGVLLAGERAVRRRQPVLSTPNGGHR